MNNQVEQVQQSQPAFVGYINAVESDFNELATGENAVKWREECEFAMQLLNSNAKLRECTPISLQASIKNIASVGLSLNPAHGFAYLVPEGKKKAGGGWEQECQLRISFTGLIKLAIDSGSIKIVKAEIVHANDEFIYNGALEMPKHSMANPFKMTDRGEPIGVYCVAITHENRAICDIMSWDEVMKIKSKAKTQYVWNDWPLEMAKKTIIKRAYKQWPKSSPMFSTAVSLSNQNEGSLGENDLSDIQIDRMKKQEAERLSHANDTEEANASLFKQLNDEIEATSNQTELNDSWSVLSRNIDKLPKAWQQELHRIAQRKVNSWGKK